MSSDCERLTSLARASSSMRLSASTMAGAAPATADDTVAFAGLHLPAFRAACLRSRTEAFKRTQPTAAAAAEGGTLPHARSGWKV